MVLYLANHKRVTSIDFREKAPLHATRDMFLDEGGTVDSEQVRHSHLAVGVPGTVAGLLRALDLFGTMTLEEVLAPAIQLAEQGILVSEPLSENA